MSVENDAKRIAGMIGGTGPVFIYIAARGFWKAYHVGRMWTLPSNIIAHTLIGLGGVWGAISAIGLQRHQEWGRRACVTIVCTLSSTAVVWASYVTMNPEQIWEQILAVWTITILLSTVAGAFAWRLMMPDMREHCSKI